MPLLKRTSLLAALLHTGRAGAGHGGGRDGAGGRAVPRDVVALAAGDGAGATLEDKGRFSSNGTFPYLLLRSTLA